VKSRAETNHKNTHKCGKKYCLQVKINKHGDGDKAWGYVRQIM